MAQNKSQPTPELPKVAPGIYENRTRSQWVLEHPDGDIVFGDSELRNLPEERRTPHLRSPVVPITAEQLSTMPEHSVRFLATLITKGDIELRRAAA